MILKGCKRSQDISDISEIPFGGLRNVVEFFFLFWNIFLDATKKIEKVRASRGVKNTKNWRDTSLQVNFGLFKSRQLKPCFEPSKTYVS